MRMIFAWWNTSLSPLGRRRASVNQKKFAAEIITHLITHMDVDCLALGEVTPEDIGDIASSVDLRSYALYDGTHKSGRLQFDTIVLYKKEKLFLIDSLALISSRGSKRLKVATRVDFRVPKTEKPFHIFVSHWPSRAWCEKNGADRHLLGVRLRDAIDDLYKTYSRSAYVILLGDFNDEPFDESLSEQLLAVRDRRLVRKKPKLLYNPFWRCIGEPVPHIPGCRCRSYAGSCHYSSGVDSHWRTFDQIIFSSIFLGQSEWHLNEKYTHIIQIPLFDTYLCNQNEIFDHFPVISVLEREA